MRRLELTETYILEKDGKPVWMIPDELYEDFVQIFAYAAAASRFLEETPKKEDAEKVNILSGTKQ